MTIEHITSIHEKSDKAYSNIISKTVTKILEADKQKASLSIIYNTSLVSQKAILKIIEYGRRILFPGYFLENKAYSNDIKYFIGRDLSLLFSLISEQIATFFQHKCLVDGEPCITCIRQSKRIALHFIAALPDLRKILISDTQAAIEGDPAAKSYKEIIFSYPGLFTITVYRMAHKLYELKVPLLPRMMTEYAHSVTGIDIHPGAKIGKHFFIDHGTGVVIGETTEIGDRVRIYQGVTLGALSIPRDTVDTYRNRKRHPTIEDDVIIYSNATILGPRAIIGARSIIGGNVWITERVPPDTKVILKPPELIYIGKNKEIKTASLPADR